MAGISTGSKTIYWLNQDECIAKVCSQWDQFAYENDGKVVVQSRVASRPIWDYISGDATKMWLRTLLNLCRVRNAPVERPYRCDSPEKKRYMTMTIFPEEGGKLRVEHRVKKEEERSKPVYIAPGTGNKLCFRCSICGRIKKDEQWYEPDDSTLNAGNSDRTHQVAYTVCGQCKG